MPLADAPRPPVAKRVPVERDLHGEVVVDEYAWLRDRDDPDTLAYLKAENEYTDAVMAGAQELREQLFEEIRSHVQETDVGAPIPWGDWEYYQRTVEGLQYEIHCRRPRGGNPSDEQVLLDENELAEDLEYLNVGAVAVSPDHRKLAYAVDTSGDIVFTVHIKDLDTGDILTDELEDVFGGLEWAADSNTLYYVVIDEAHRSYRLRRHVLGESGDDPMVYEEPDERFWVSLGKGRDGRLLVLESASKTTSEVRLVDAHHPDAKPRVVEPRRDGVEYHVEPHADRLFIMVNDDGAENFRLVSAPLDTPGRDRWDEILPHRHDVKLEDLDAFARHLVVVERAEALERLRILDLESGDSYVVDQPEEAYSAAPGANLEFDTNVLRYRYTSLVTPTSDVDLDMDRGDATVVRRQPVPGYDPDRFATARLWATAPDGERVPISIAYRRDVERDGSAPAFLIGYGAYELSYDPGFSATRLPLLDRGWVVAIAHVRGGGEMGRPWYDGGKMLAKQSTFTDFIACAEHLVAEGWTSPDGLCARGGSAGGLLMGAAVNLRPDLFRAVQAMVPFVDVVNTMLDASLPLTITEWEEWGDPHDAETYRYMRSYAPYENVGAKRYPAMLVTAGLNDSQVQFWEPAKWVARLRATKTDANPLLLKTELGAGHAGPSGRYEAWRDEALFLAFLLRAVEDGQVDDAG